MKYGNVQMAKESYRASPLWKEVWWEGSGAGNCCTLPLVLHHDLTCKNCVILKIQKFYLKREKKNKYIQKLASRKQRMTAHKNIHF